MNRQPYSSCESEPDAAEHTPVQGNGQKSSQYIYIYNIYIYIIIYIYSLFAIYVCVYTFVILPCFQTTYDIRQDRNWTLKIWWSSEKICFILSPTHTFTDLTELGWKVLILLCFNIFIICLTSNSNLNF